MIKFGTCRKAQKDSVWGLVYQGAVEGWDWTEEKREGVKDKSFEAESSFKKFSATRKFFEVEGVAVEPEHSTHEDCSHSLQVREVKEQS